MFKFLKFTRNNLISLLISIIIFIIFSTLYSSSTLFDGIEKGAVNFRFFLRDPAERSHEIKEGVKRSTRNEKANPNIIILGIDEQTIRSFDKEKVHWPFPWDKHTKFTNYVGSGNPEAIFFDIMFLENKDTIGLTDFKKQFEKKLLLNKHSKFTKKDILNNIDNFVNEYELNFAKAIKQAKVVYLDFPFETEKIGNLQTDYEDYDERIEVLNQTRFALDPNDKSEIWVEEVLPPLASLSKAAKGIGYANIKTDRDHVNRTVPLLIKYNKYYYPSIDLVLVMNHYNITQKDIEIKMGEYIKLKNIPTQKMKKPNKENQIIIPIDNEGKMDINFIGGHGSFTNISYKYFVRDGKIKNKSLKDKIVLVAAYAVTGISTDIHKSPYGDLFGIEHHANALNTILNQDFLIKFTDNENILILLIIAIVLGLLLPRFKIIFTIIFTLLLSIIYFITSYSIFETNNVLVIFAIPHLQILITFSFILTFRLLTEQKEKRYIRQTFSKFVSKSVVDDLLKNPHKLKLGGERKLLTVLFSDIRGFTSISEKLTPEELVEQLNEYLQAMTDIVIKYNGTLDKYVGDEIMAFWGAPIPQADHTYLSCQAALEMMLVLEKLNNHWEKIGNPKLDIGIGINSGDMIVGNMGSHSRMDYTLMGDNVNLGARLEGTNKVYDTKIIISEQTYDIVRDQVIVRELDLIRVKGKEQPVTIYELIDLKE